MKAPIRILQVLTVMNRGGAETMIMNYYRQIDRTQVQFDFLLHRAERGVFDDEIEALGGTIYRMMPISPKNYATYKRKLKDFFKEHHYTIVHSHLNALSLFVLQEAKRAGVAVRIAHSHIATEPITLHSFFAKNKRLRFVIKDSIQNYLKRFVPGVATHYFACGEKAGQWLFGKKNANKIVVIHNAIKSGDFVYNKEIASAVKKSLKLTDYTLIGHIGRFDDQKNHIFLIKIFKELYNSNNNIHLVLVGDGPLKEQIKAQVKTHNLQDCVHFLGLREDVPQLLQAMDVILFPSLYEGLPLALLEAQAAGLKVITSTTVDPNVAVTGNVQFLSLEQTVNEWAEAVIQALPYTRKNTHTAIINAGYDITKNANELQRFYFEQSQY